MAYMLVFYVPEAQAEAVKAAVFASGAGRLGRYEHCCWQSVGMGQFRPLPGSRPFIGSEGDLERVAEVRVEMVCPRESLGTAIEGLLKAHPYETPAYHYWEISGVE